MQIRIYMVNGNYRKEDALNGEWLTLPMKYDELEDAFLRISGDDAAWRITDFEAPFMIDWNDDVYAINEAAAIFAGYDSRLVYALCGCTENMSQVIQILKNGRYLVYYEVECLRDVAERLIKSGYYSNVPAAIKRYIDFDRMVQDLVDDGWHMQYEVNVAVLPLS